MLYFDMFGYTEITKQLYCTLFSQYAHNIEQNKTEQNRIALFNVGKSLTREH